MDASELRKLDTSRVSQVVVVPDGRGPYGPQRGIRGASPQPVMTRGQTENHYAASPAISPAIPTVSPAISPAISQVAPREIKVEVVEQSRLEETVRNLQVQMQTILQRQTAAEAPPQSFDDRFSSDSSHPSSWRGIFEAQLSQHEQTLSRVQAKVNSLEQQATHQAEAEERLLMQQAESIRAVQADMKKLQDQQVTSNTAAQADRVGIDIELKDLRIHLDAQAKNLQQQLGNWNSEIAQLKGLVYEQSTGSITADCDLKYLKESIKAQEQRILSLDGDFQKFQDRPQDKTMTSSDMGDVEEQLSQQAQFIREMQSELLALRNEQRDTSQALATTTQAASRGTSLTMSSVSEVQAELQSLRSGSEKHQAEMILKQSMLAKDLSDVKTQLAVDSAGDFRKNFEVRLAQQDLTIQGLRSQLSSIDEKTQELTQVPSRQPDSQVADEVDALKKELAAHRLLQASELSSEADALHVHVHKEITAEREARSSEVTRFQSMVTGLKGEVSQLADDLRRSISERSKPAMQALPKPIESYECVNPKLM